MTVFKIKAVTAVLFLSLAMSMLLSLQCNRIKQGASLEEKTKPTQVEGSVPYKEKPRVIECIEDELSNDTLETAALLDCGATVSSQIATSESIDIYQGSIAIGEYFVMVIEAHSNINLIQARVLTPSGEADPTSATVISGNTLVVYSGDPFGFESGLFFLEVTSSGCVDYTITSMYCIDPFPFNEDDPVDVKMIASSECVSTGTRCTAP